MTDSDAIAIMNLKQEVLLSDGIEWPCYWHLFDLDNKTVQEINLTLAYLIIFLIKFIAIETGFKFTFPNISLYVNC